MMHTALQQLRTVGWRDRLCPFTHADLQLLTVSLHACFPLLEAPLACMPLFASTARFSCCCNAVLFCPAMQR